MRRRDRAGGGRMSAVARRRRPPAPDTGPTRARLRAARGLLRARELGIVARAGRARRGRPRSVNPRFLSAQSVRDLLLGAVDPGACWPSGRPSSCITRNIDLSVGSVLGLSAFAVPARCCRPPRASPVVGRAARRRRASARSAGWSTGRSCASATCPRWWSRSARSTSSAGIGFFWAGGQQINADDLPPAFLRLRHRHRARRAVAAAHRAGRVVLAAGYVPAQLPARAASCTRSAPTREAARLAGIPVGRRVLAAFVRHRRARRARPGCCSPPASARSTPPPAPAASCSVVAAVVVGGVAIFGGSGTVYGAALGALLLTTIGSALPVLGIDQFWQQAIVGALILGAIGTRPASLARSGWRRPAAPAGTAHRLR